MGRCLTPHPQAKALQLPLAALRQYESVDACLLDAEVDVVDVAGSVHERGGVVAAAIAAGKAVISEPPVALSRAAAQILWTAFQEKGSSPWCVLCRARHQAGLPRKCSSPSSSWLCLQRLGLATQWEMIRKVGAL